MVPQISAGHAFAAQNTIYSAGTMLSLYVISMWDICQGKGKIEARDEEGFFLKLSTCRSEGGRMCSVHGGSLCYSPTCTPAQLSLLSEAIAKYSAFAASRNASSPAAAIFL